MSSQSYSTFHSSSYSSYSDSSGRKYQESTTSNPSGTTTYRSVQEAGQPAVSETTRFSAGGSAAQQVEGLGGSNRRIEDVTDADADGQYEERMEDEYAKREGGAWAWRIIVMGMGCLGLGVVARWTWYIATM